MIASRRPAGAQSSIAPWRTDLRPDRIGHPARRLVRAALLCGIVDGLWAVALTLIYGRTVVGLFQRVAATAFGPAMLEGGVATALLGLGIHLGVAFAWSAFFLVLFLSWPRLRRVLSTGAGTVAVAAVYGPFIWVVMSAGLIPLLTGSPVALSFRWWVQAAGHVVFVGVPIVWGIGRDPLPGRGAAKRPPTDR